MSTGNFQARVDLKKLPAAGVANIKGRDGQLHKCLVIDIDKAHLFHSEKGAVYLDLIVWENPNGLSQYGDTHMVKQSLSKAVRDSLATLPQEEREAQTRILGNMRPSTETMPQPTPPEVTTQAEVQDDNDLPF